MVVVFLADSGNLLQRFAEERVAICFSLIIGVDSHCDDIA